MDRVKVLLLVPNLRVANGVSSFVINYYREIKKDSISIDFALYSDRPSPYYNEIRSNGNKIFILPSIKSLGKHLATCQSILENGQYDIVHDNTLHVSIPMMWCAKNKGTPVRILHSHNTKLGETQQKEVRNRLFLPLLRGLATDYAACSELAGEAMFGQKPFDIIPNVISSDNYRFDAKKRQIVREQMNAGRKYIIGTVGRLAEQKNPFFAVEVIKKLHEEMPDTEYWWIGSGDLDNQIKEYIESCGALNYIKLLGSRNDVLDFYQAMDCFFLPSMFEGLPVTGVEAQAMGLPMVVSDTVTKEMVYTDLVDYVNLSESINVWVKHLKKALSRKVDRKIYSGKLKQSVFSDVGCGERLGDLYENLLRRHGGI